MSQDSEEKMIIGLILMILGIAFAIVSLVYFIKAIKEINKLKDKDIKIEFKYSETKKKE
jgi:Na+-transporting methylmalonyl-CoA/oxaloacetate decarboxylase gamma subunit